MPPDVLPAELKPALAEFLKAQKLFLSGPRGKASLRDVSGFGQTLRSPTEPGLFVGRGAAAAGSAMDWMMRLPQELLEHEKAPLLDLADMGKKGASLAMAAGLQVIALGSKALLAGRGKPPKLAAEAILHAAFGADKSALAIRKPIIDPKFPWVTPFDLGNLPDISKLVREGSLREVIRTFAECGYVAQQERNWVGQVKSFGRVTGLVPNRACGGQVIQIRYADFGAAPPSAASIADIMISLPTLGGCVRVSLRSIVPDFFDQARWAGQGTIPVTLPADVTTGCIGFFSVPPPLEATGPCTGGSLATAAGMLQSILTDQFGPQGTMIGQVVVDVAIKAEAGRHGTLPCADCQTDNLNHLDAGPPFIKGFRVVESGSVHPRGTVTLQWSVGNADRIEIVARPIAGSENPHELPPITGTLPLEGRSTLAVPCTRRWEAEYVLRASNANGCTTAPIEAVVALKSGYSDYRIGAAKADVTDRRPGLGMAGFAWKGQKTSGRVHSGSDLIEIPQFARAFVIEENRAAANRVRVAIVVADIWTCTLAVKREVVKRLNDMYHPPQFSEETVLIAGTHTHAGAGGYSEYFLYNLTPQGFDQQVFDTIVSGIVTAITTANVTKVPGRIFANAADLADCGANRSFEALERNVGFDRNKPELWTDREMLLLKFVADVDNRGTTRPIGALNWYAIHPTSLGMFNADVSGDSKGRAGFLFEKDRTENEAAPHFVAAFGNGSAGDVSGNVTLDRQGNKIVTKPLGGAATPAASFPPLIRSSTAGAQDVRRMEALGERQFQHALDLYEAATQEITGPITTAHFFQDMSNVAIRAKPGARTWPAALGVSFGAGSSEDSIAYATVDLPFSLGTLDIDAGIIEGMTHVEMVVGAIEAVPILVALALRAPVTVAAIAGAILTQAPISAVLVPEVLKAITLFVLPHARSCVASQVAALMFPGEVTNCPPRSDEGTWTWVPPPAANLTAECIAGHAEKPIMFNVGMWCLSFTPTSGGAAQLFPCPLVPHVLPLHLLRIGSVAIAGVPAEFTSTAGLRLKGDLLAASGGTLTHVAVSNYSNGYSGYVATEEEYGAQHYEGASTLYGPHTLAAYRQTFDMLAAIVFGRLPKMTNPPKPFVVPAVFHKL